MALQVADGNPSRYALATLDPKKVLVEGLDPLITVDANGLLFDHRGKRLNYSHSAGSTAGACLRKYWFDRVAAVEVPTGRPLVIGIGVHDLLESWLDAKTPEERDAVLAATTGLSTDDFFFRQVAKSGVHHLPTPEDFPNLLVEDWLDCGLLDEGEGDARRMMRFKGKIDFGDLLGKLAAIWHPATLPDGTPSIADHKTCSSFDYLPSTDELRLNRQALTYSAAAIFTHPSSPWAHWKTDAPPLPERVAISHVYYRTKSGRASMPVHAVASWEDVEDAWQSTERLAGTMYDVACEPDVEQVPFRHAACTMYKGCEFAAICSQSPKNRRGGNSPLRFLLSGNTRTEPNGNGATIMSLKDLVKKQRGGTATADTKAPAEPTGLTPPDAGANTPITDALLSDVADALHARGYVADGVATLAGVEEICREQGVDPTALHMSRIASIGEFAIDGLDALTVQSQADVDERLRGALAGFGSVRKIGRQAAESALRKAGFDVDDLHLKMIVGLGYTIDGFGDTKKTKGSATADKGDKGTAPELPFEPHAVVVETSGALGLTEAAFDALPRDAVDALLVLWLVAYCVGEHGTDGAANFAKAAKSAVGTVNAIVADGHVVGKKTSRFTKARFDKIAPVWLVRSTADKFDARKATITVDESAFTAATDEPDPVAEPAAEPEPVVEPDVVRPVPAAPAPAAPKIERSVVRPPVSGEAPKPVFVDVGGAGDAAVAAFDALIERVEHGQAEASLDEARGCLRGIAAESFADGASPGANLYGLIALDAVLVANLPGGQSAAHVRGVYRKHLEPTLDADGFEGMGAKARMKAVDALDAATLIVVPPSWDHLAGITQAVFDDAAERLIQRGFEQGVVVGEQKPKAVEQTSTTFDRVEHVDVVDVGLVVYVGCGPTYANGSARSVADPIPLSILLAPYMRAVESDERDDGDARVDHWNAFKFHRGPAHVAAHFRRGLARDGALLHDGVPVKAVRVDMRHPAAHEILPMLEEIVALSGGLVIRR